MEEPPTAADDLVIFLKRVISQISGELQTRFSHDQQGVMRVVVAFCPSSPDFMDVQLLNSVSRGYGFTIPECEIDVFKSFLKRSIQLNSLSLIFSTCADWDIFPSIHQLLKILLTIPQTSVTVERLFSSVKRIKTHIRSSMSTSRLSALTFLSIESATAIKKKRINIIERFRLMKNRLLL